LLLADQFGNYLAQRVIDASSPAQLDKLIVEVSPRLHAVACNVHGTRAVQKLVDCVKTKEQVHTHYQYPYLAEHLLPSGWWCVR
jgi:hypothetical protein